MSKRKRVEKIFPANRKLSDLNLEANSNINVVMYNTKTGKVCARPQGEWELLPDGKDFVNKVSWTSRRYIKYALFSCARWESRGMGKLSFVLTHINEKWHRSNLEVEGEVWTIQVGGINEDQETESLIICGDDTLNKFIEFANYVSMDALLSFVKENNGRVNEDNESKLVTKNDVPDLDPKYVDIIEDIDSYETYYTGFIEFNGPDKMILGISCNERNYSENEIVHFSNSRLTRNMDDVLGPEIWDDYIKKGGKNKLVDLLQMAFHYPNSDIRRTCLIIDDDLKNHLNILFSKDPGAIEKYYEDSGLLYKIDDTQGAANELNVIVDRGYLNAQTENVIDLVKRKDEENQRLLQAALRYGYKTSHERMMYWFFYDQPFNPDREVWADEIRRQQEGSRTIIDHENDPKNEPVDGEKIPRRPTDRALQGRLNVEIVYPSGKIYPGRMRATIDSLAVIEPAKGDRVAWLCDLNTVRDMTRIDLSIVPYERVYHTPKNLEWLKNMTYINVWDY